MSDEKEKSESPVLSEKEQDELYHRLTSKASRLAADELFNASEDELNVSFTFDKAHD
ncbi:MULTISPECIES: hypothetical protein [Methylophaga]|jgi:hypothetical protein|uniref:hypothetical protein n=1 Tax=Methylophaga TaxID=40222 RepID=UPI00259C7C79|nr:MULTISPECIES: hypothetical protein [Methylophaga]WVI84016.1 hypothetical protein VSX76_09540 [Methylophaga thalassica]|tara:strand:+ start:637 stop:807 length:171 start_codon:yes stop_codon:yes gene_type:complete